MIALRVSDAVELVRKNLDELEPNGSVMYGPDMDEMNDNNSIDDIIARNLPEAINTVHIAAPVRLLEGNECLSADVAFVSLKTGGLFSFSLQPETNFLRLVAFKAKDSDVVVTDVLAEASAEGRKQLNHYVCGRYDRPRLVLRQGYHTGPSFVYYSLNENGEKYESYVTEPMSAVERLEYIKEKHYSAEAKSYEVSRRLRMNVIDLLTAMVLETYVDQRAQAFYQRANNYNL